MNRKRKLPRKIIEEIDLYRKGSPSTIGKIKVLWAMTRKQRLYPLDGRKMFLVDLKSLVKVADFGEFIGKNLNPERLFTGVDERDFRVAKILNRWSKGEYIDPPELCLSHEQKITFGDGRHRTIAAFHLKESVIPILLNPGVVKKVSQKLHLRKP